MKVIRIRKVLGASITQATHMLSTEFFKLVLIASLIAFPVANWIMQKWWKNFACRVNIKSWLFVLAGLSAIFFSSLPVGFQALKAAVVNPIKSFRTG